MAIPGTLLFGHLADRFGHKRSILVCLVVWSMGVAAAYFVATPGQYWALCLVLGFVLGGVQAVSRSLFARLVPAEREAEFFGFYAVAGRFSSIFGPLIYGLAILWTGGVRQGILSLIIFFLAGFLLLLTVDESRGKREAQG